MVPDLVEGTRYIQADSERRIESLRATISVIARLTLGIVACFIIASFVIFTHRVALLPALFLLVTGSVALAILFVIWRQLSIQMLNLNDTIVAQGAGILVVKPDGCRLGFSNSAKRRRTSGFLGGRFKRFELWTENGRSYLLDRSHLIAQNPQSDEVVSEALV